MQYALLMCGDAAHDETPTAMPPELAAQWDVFWGAQADGAPVLGWNALAPTATASTLRVGVGGPVVTDGPLAETKEQLGGLIVIERADLAAGLALAVAVPCAPRGSIEVRAIAEAGQRGWRRTVEATVSEAGRPDVAHAGARRAVQQLFREEQSRITATLSRACGGDFELAKDALQEAVALERWPVSCAAPRRG